MALVVVALAATGASMAGAATTPGAAPPLESAVLSQALPGFTAEPAGPTNGPLTATEFASQSSSPNQAEAQFNAMATQPGFDSFIRLWTDRGGPGNGTNDIAVLVFRIPSTTVAGAFAAGLLVPFEQSPGTAQFDVPSIPGARGFSLRASTPVAATEQVVVFRAGRYVTMLQLASATSASNPSPLTSAQAVTASYQQYRQLQTVDPLGARTEPAPVPSRSATATTATPVVAPGGGSSVPVVLLAGVAAVLVVAGAVMILLRRRRTGGSAEADPWGPGGIFAALGAVDPHATDDAAGDDGSRTGDRVTGVTVSVGAPARRDRPAQTVPALVPSADARVGVGAATDSART